MKLSRRRAFGVAAAVVAASSVARPGWAQVYPSRPVRVIVPVAAGAANDTSARWSFAKKPPGQVGQAVKGGNWGGGRGHSRLCPRRSGAGGRLYVACWGRQLRDQSEPLCQNSLRSL